MFNFISTNPMKKESLKMEGKLTYYLTVKIPFQTEFDSSHPYWNYFQCGENHRISSMNPKFIPNLESYLEDDFVKNYLKLENPELIDDIRDGCFDCHKFWKCENGKPLTEEPTFLWNFGGEKDIEYFKNWNENHRKKLEKQKEEN